ncbi:Ig-like domain-containing protein, partial [Pararcticibacter amylolyticus]
MNFTRIALAIVFCSFCGIVNAQTWQPLGQDGTGYIRERRVGAMKGAVSPGGMSYVASSNYSAVIEVAKLNNGVWEKLTGSPGTSEDYDFDLAPDETPFIAFKNNSGLKASVKKYSNGSWQTVGSLAISTGNATNLALAFDKDGVPYISYYDESLSQVVAAVFRDNGWQSLGGVAASTSKRANDIAIDGNGVVYLAYSDNANTNKATVVRLSGSSWETVGVAGISGFAVTSVRLAIDNANTPFVGYASGDIMSNNIGVSKFTGGVWSNVGNVAAMAATRYSYDLTLLLDGAGLPVVNVNQSGLPFMSRYTGTAWQNFASYSSSCDYSSVDVDANGIFYAYYRESANSYKPVASKFNGTWSKISLVDELPYASGGKPDVFIDNSGVVNVLYGDGSVGNSGTLRKFVNGSWALIGQQGFASGVYDPKTVTNSSNVPYTIYTLSSSSYKGTVKTLNNGTWQSVGAATISVGEAASADIAIDASDKIYISFVDKGSSNQLTVMTYNGSAWQNLNTGVSGVSDFAWMELDPSGIPYVAYLQTSKLYVIRYVNGAWEPVGTYSASSLAMMHEFLIDKAGKMYFSVNGVVGGVLGNYLLSFSNGEWKQKGTRYRAGSTSTGSVSMELDKNKLPYISYIDETIQRIRVSRFFNGQWQLIGDYPLPGAYANFANLAIKDNTLVALAASDGAWLASTTLPVITAGTTSNLTASIGDRKTLLKWDAVNQALKYRVYSINVAGNSTFITETTDTQYEVTGLTNGTTYRYSVSAVDVNGEGIYPDEVSITPFGGTVAITNNLTVTNNTSIKLTVNATDVTAQMSFSNDALTWSAWEAYSTNKDWTLTSGDGSKTVYVKFKLNSYESPAYSTSINLDMTAPAAPTVVMASSNAAGYTQLLKPTVNGTTEANAIVSLYLDGSSTKLTDVTANSSGAWSYVFTTNLSEAAHSVTAKATDLAGNISVNSAAFNFTVDKTVPVTAITAMPGLNSGFTKESKPTVNGTTEANATVSLYLNGSSTKLADVTAGTDGIWSYTFTSNLVSASYSLKASSTDLAGNAGVLSAAFNFTVDLTAPAVPVITSLTGRNAAGYTQQSKPTVSGTAEANATVSLFLDGSSTKLTDVTANGSGAWSYIFTTDLTEAAHSIIAQATDLAGNTGVSSVALAFTVDKTAPVSPVVSTLTGLNSGYTKESKPTVSGTAEAGVTVSLYLDGSSTKLADVTAAGGAWSYTFATNLMEGAHNIKVSATDPAGNAGVSSAAFNFNVDKTAPVVPVISTISGKGTGNYSKDQKPTITGTAEPNTTIRILVDGNASSTTDVTAGNDGMWSYTFTTSLAEGSYLITARSTDAAGNASTSSASALIIDITPPYTPSVIWAKWNIAGYTNIRGSSDGYTTVSIFIDGSSTKIADVAIPASGDLSYNYVADLAEGGHTVELIATDRAGNTRSAVAPFAFNVDKTAPAAPVVVSATWGRSVGYTRTTKPIISGTSEANAIVTLYQDGSSTKLADVTASGSGTWSYTPTIDLTEASHSFTATATDQSGNVSALSAALSFIVDLTAPDVPVISSVAGKNAAGYTRQSKPTMSGTTEVGSDVTLYLDGSTVRYADASTNASGVWVFSPSANLSEGEHFITAKAYDKAGNSSVLTAAFNFIVDTTAPVAPVISDISGKNAAGYTQQSKPVVTGTSEANITVSLYLDGSGTKLADATANGSGVWSYTFISDLADGAHSITAKATDLAGNVSVSSAAFSFTVDKTAPAAPVISALSGKNAAGYTQQTKPTVSGTAEANTTVSLYLDGSSTKLADVTANGSGVWSYIFTTDLSEAVHSITAQSTDLAGNTGVQSAALAFTVDKTAPAAAATITMSSRNAAGYTKILKPAISGNAEANGKVRLYLDGSTTLLAEVSVSSSGVWSYTFASNLTEKPYTLKAVIVDAAGNVGPDSDVFNFIVDATAPAIPVVTTVTGRINGEYTKVSRPTVSGTADPNTVVSLFLNGNSTTTNRLTDNIPVGADGKWSYELTSDLPAVRHFFMALTTDAAGNSTLLSSPFYITVDLTAPDAPTVAMASRNAAGYTKLTKPVVSGNTEGFATIDIFVDGNPTKAASVTASSVGSWSYTFTADLAESQHTIVAVATDRAGNTGIGSSVFTFTVDKTAPVTTVTQVSGRNAAGYTSQSKPVVSGTTKANAIVSLYLDGSLTKLVDVTADGSGTWSYTFVSDLADGAHSLAADAIDLAGNTGLKSAAFTFTVDTSVPAVPAEPTVPGGNGSATNDTTPTFSGTAEPGASVTVVIDGQTYGPAIAGSDGKWEIAVSPSLSEGNHTVKVAVTDKAGNTSESTEKIITIKTDKPATPEQPTVPGGNGSATNDTTPTFSGTAEPGTKIEVVIDGKPYGPVYADQNGHWELVINPALAEGGHIVTVKATDIAGNISESAETTITVKTDKPVTPEQPTVPGGNGSATNDTTPTFSGTAEPGTKIEVVIDGKPYGPVYADQNGHWELVINPALTEGGHTVTVKATDIAGNVSESAETTITVKTDKPVTPEPPTVPGGNGSATNDTTPTFSGTAEPGTKIEIVIDGKPYGPVYADQNGHWEITLSEELG